MTPHDKQVMMFSATLSKEIRPVCKKFMQDVITCSLLQLSFPKSSYLIPIAPMVVVLQLLVIYQHQSCSRVICSLQLKGFLVPQCLHLQYISQWCSFLFLYPSPVHQKVEREGLCPNGALLEMCWQLGQIKEDAFYSEDAVMNSWTTYLQFAAHTLSTWFRFIGLYWCWFSIYLVWSEKELFCWNCIWKHCCKT